MGRVATLEAPITHIVPDVFHGNSVCPDPAVAANIDPGESLRLILDAAVRVFKTVLMFAAEKMDVVAKDGVVADGD